MSQILSNEERVTIAQAILPLDVSDLDALEVCNTEVGQHHECFELGPFDGHRYVRIRSTDNVALADQLRRLLDDVTTSTFDERDAKARAEMGECPGCRTRVAPDEVSCGASRCERIASMESRL